MKGFVEEMVYSIIISLVIFMLFVFFTYQRGTRGIEVRKIVEERGLSEEGTSTVFTLFNNKLPFVEKTYLECAIDAILQGIYLNKEQNKVFYGVGVGEVNLTEIIPPLLEKYVSGRWELAIIMPKVTYTYGGIERKNVIYSYESLIPIPEERVGRVVFLLGKPS